MATYEYGKWYAYTPTFTGFGTPTNVSFAWKREGGSLKVMGKFTAGTTTAVEAQISLPLSLTSDSNLVPTIRLAGIVGRSSTAATSDYILIDSGVSYVNFSNQNVSTAALTKVTASSVYSTGITLSVQFELPVSGWN